MALSMSAERAPAKLQWLDKTEKFAAQHVQLIIRNLGISRNSANKTLNIREPDFVENTDRTGVRCAYGTIYSNTIKNSCNVYQVHSRLPWHQIRICPAEIETQESNMSCSH